MPNLTIAGSEIQQLQPLAITGSVALPASQATSNGRYKAGKLTVTDVTNYIAKNINLGDKVLTKYNSYFYIELTYNDKVATDLIFGGFNPVVDYELFGIDVSFSTPVTGNNTADQITFSVYNHTSATLVGDPITILKYENNKQKIYNTKPTLTQGSSYGIKILSAVSAATVKEISVRFILNPLLKNSSSIGTYGVSNTLTALTAPPTGLTTTSGAGSGSLWVNNGVNPPVLYIAVADSAGKITWVNLSAGPTVGGLSITNITTNSNFSTAATMMDKLIEVTTTAAIQIDLTNFITNGICTFVLRGSGSIEFTSSANILSVNNRKKLSTPNCSVSVFFTNGVYSLIGRLSA